MKENVLNRFKIVAPALLLMALLPLNGQAEEVEATFMNIYTTSGQTESVMFTSSNPFMSPRLLKTEKRLTFNGQSIDIADVAYITFEKRMVEDTDGVPALDVPAVIKQDDTVYDMSGRQVGKGKTTDLPKGLYIMNGKKFVIK